MKKPLPLYFWTEPIDQEMCALHARMRTMSRGRLLGHTVFMVVRRVELQHYQTTDRRWVSGAEQVRDALKAKFKASLIANHYGQLPILGYVDSNDPEYAADRVGIC